MPTLGPLELVLNTPAHHRVHHASNNQCLDKNYGGVLIVFDRLFGTFAQAPKDEPLRYGLVGRTPGLNPCRIALNEWIHLIKEVRAADSSTKRLTILFGPPGGRESVGPVDTTRHRGDTRSHKPVSTVLLGDAEPTSLQRPKPLQMKHYDSYSSFSLRAVKTFCQGHIDTMRKDGINSH